ncbi:MAG: M48 family metalloprotease [Cytophagales bacterium]|nr:M48 family metalloprotease [Cytophagales bacterium]
MIQLIKQKLVPYAFLLASLAACQGCKEGEGLNILSLEQDVELGRQVSAEIEKDPKQYPLLPETGREGRNEQAYAYLRGIVTRILNSGQVTHKDDLPWQVKIIQNDTTLNAFAAPGGFIYVYTGIIKYLDTEDQLAGVLAHEIAHADKRHTSRTITREYGYDLILTVLLGENQSTLVNLARGLVGLRYSRGFEEEADQFSVVYLCNTQYRADGAAGFFQKMQEEGGGQGVPEFLSTHPNPGDRVTDITRQAQDKNCNLNNFPNAQYAQFKSLLP